MSPVGEPCRSTIGGVTSDKTKVRRRGALFFIGVVVLAYVLFSVAVAIGTVDTCGDEDAPKHWSFFPPEWVCE